jgi:flagellar biosynthesis anti-sigma factor FlgM
MRVNDPNLTSVVANGTSRTHGAGRTGQNGRANGTSQSGSATSADDIHLSELVRSLRSMAADSPERQARIEQIARDYAGGTYKVDASATASKMIDDFVSNNGVTPP